MDISTILDRTLAGFFAQASACGAGERAILAAHHSITVAEFSAFLSSLVACLDFTRDLFHVTTARDTSHGTGHKAGGSRHKASSRCQREVNLVSPKWASRTQEVLTVQPGCGNQLSRRLAAPWSQRAQIFEHALKALVRFQCT